MQLKLLKLGCRPFAEVLEIQNQLWAELLEERSPSTGWVITTEHPPVITYGKRETGASLQQPLEEIQRRGVDVVSINRGGLATIHTPGQLVIYFIIPLRAWKLRVKSFIATLENSMAMACRNFGVAARAGSTSGLPVGVWVNHKKIGQIGISVNRGITQHGLALNVSNDLHYFELIDPCGLGNVAITSIKNELLSTTTALPTLDQVAQQVLLAL